MKQANIPAWVPHPVWSFCAKVLSFVINPNFCQFFIYVYLRNTSHAGLISMSLLFLAAIPLAGYVLYVRYGLKRDNLYVLERSKRYIPFFINIISVITFVYLMNTTFVGGGKNIDAMDSLADFLLFINGLTLIITMFWRISIHMIAASASMALLMFEDTGIVLSILNCLLFLILFLVGWSRWYLRGHTVSQIIGGAILGFSITLLFLKYKFMMGL